MTVASAPTPSAAVPTPAVAPLARTGHALPVIALLPNFTLIPAGARIQLVLTSQPPASFHSPLAPTPQQLAHLAGGRYTVERGTLAASRLDLPLAPADTFSTSPTNWGPPS